MKPQVQAELRLLLSTVQPLSAQPSCRGGSAARICNLEVFLAGG